MIRRYCDICGEEIKGDYVSDRLRTYGSKIRVEIMVGSDTTYNKGEFCLTCIRQEVMKLIDQTRTTERTI